MRVGDWGVLGRASQGLGGREVAGRGSDLFVLLGRIQSVRFDENCDELGLPLSGSS